MTKQRYDIAVCDDVQTDREETAQLTEEICKAEGILPRIARFERAEALLEAIQGGEHFALLLVDVLLPEHDFIRCHQSFLVNWHHVQSLRTDVIELTDKRIVPVSKHRVKQVRQAFVDYMKM